MAAPKKKVDKAAAEEGIVIPVVGGPVADSGLSFVWADEPPALVRLSIEDYQKGRVIGGVSLAHLPLWHSGEYRLEGGEYHWTPSAS